MSQKTPTKSRSRIAKTELSAQKRNPRTLPWPEFFVKKKGIAKQTLKSARILLKMENIEETYRDSEGLRKARMTILHKNFEVTIRVQFHCGEDRVVLRECSFCKNSDQTKNRNCLHIMAFLFKVRFEDAKEKNKLAEIKKTDEVEFQDTHLFDYGENAFFQKFARFLSKRGKEEPKLSSEIALGMEILAREAIKRGGDLKTLFDTILKKLEGPGGWQDLAMIPEVDEDEQSQKNVDSDNSNTGAALAEEEEENPHRTGSQLLITENKSPETKERDPKTAKVNLNNKKNDDKTQNNRNFFIKSAFFEYLNKEKGVSEHEDNGSQEDSASENRDFNEEGPETREKRDQKKVKVNLSPRRNNSKIQEENYNSEEMSQGNLKNKKNGLARSFRETDFGQDFETQIKKRKRTNVIEYDF